MMSPQAARQYFTPERLKRYRELHFRYPLWCGNWPQKGVPEQLRVSRIWRLFRAFEESDSDATLWKESSSDATLRKKPSWAGPPIKFSLALPDEPSKETVSFPEFSDATPLTDPVDHDERLILFPAVIQALLGAITYVTACWEPESPHPAVQLSTEPWQELWPMKVKAILETPGPFSVGATKRGWSVSGMGLWRLYLLATLRGDPDSREASSKVLKASRKKLVKYWQKIGEEAGIIPTQKGKHHTIPEDLLKCLRDESEELLREIREFQPDDEERRAVRDLLTAGPVAAPGHWATAVERNQPERQVKDPMKAEQATKGWESAVNLDQWILRLAFPLLTLKELDKARETRPGSFLWLPAERFEVDEERMREQISRFDSTKTPSP